MIVLLMYEVRAERKFQSRPEIVSLVGRECACSRYRVFGNNAVHLQFCDDSSYFTELRENGCTDISPANCKIAAWSDDGEGNSLKTERICK